MTSPSVIVSLSPSGGLQLELPGVVGTARIIPLRRTTSIDPVKTIETVLVALAAGQHSIGLDGAPTRAQVDHWERHQTFPDARCAFCRAAAALARVGRGSISHPSSAKFDARYASRQLGEVTVRRVPMGATRAQVAARDKKPDIIKESPKSAKQLGF